ncbi:MAG: leucine-rich repeat domain-containing protein, partial [Oscillospiraceae bacterium]|nr:leucine-rich repeat domain-containing protein [Oscillospiraceae bacterium]
MTKRILPLLLAALLLLSLLPQLTLPAAAASSGSCGDKLNWSFNSSTGVLTITGSGDMTISGIDAPWAKYKNSITSVSLPNGLSSIGRYAFNSCSGLTAISFPSTLKTIGDHAFQYCTGLKSLSIPDGVTKISYSAFSNCSALVNVKLPSNLSTIP